MSEPIHIISLGAGVQSSTMALMAAHGEITPMPKCAIFADTQDEPQSVYKWLDWLEKQLPFPVHRVTAGKLSEKSTRFYWSNRNQKNTVSGIPFFTTTIVSEWRCKQCGGRPEHGSECEECGCTEVIRTNRKESGIFPRQCTSDFKVIPIDRRITKEMRDSGVKRCVKWIGISLDEVHRIKPSRRTTVDHIWPLINLRFHRRDCLRWMEQNNYPKPPRSACIFCPYHSDNEWRRLRKEEPDEFEKAADFETRAQLAFKQVKQVKQVPFLHRSCVPLRQVDFSTDEDQGQQVMFGNECEGMCGV